jgi:cytochrome c oxidase assembly protein subunit 15
MEHPSLHRYAILVAVCTLLLVAAGATVTSNEAGLSVPDWPLSYGKLMPEMTGGVLFEHGHRMVATAVGMLTIGLTIWLWRVERRVWMRRLGLIALAAVVVQGLLGGMTVKFLLPPAVSVSHACLAQLFFATTVAIAVFTSGSWQRGPEPVADFGTPSLRTMAILTPALVLAQIALGAAFRHRAIGLMPHLGGSMLVLLAILLEGVFVINQFPTHPVLHRAAAVMLGVTAMQIFLGLAAYVVRLEAGAPGWLMVVTTVAHVATGALTLASTAVLSIQIRRNVAARETETAQPRAAVTP